MIDTAVILETLADPDARIAVPAPGKGTGYWAGAPSAVWHEGQYVLAYRLRRPVTEGRGYANVIATSTDGVGFTVVAVVISAQFGCASLERPALVPLPGGGWRLYVSCSTEDSKHWWVEAIEAADLEGLPHGERTVVLPGDDDTAWKDVVVEHDGEQWQMWACRHPLDGGDDEADRMTSVHLSSDDGLAWSTGATALQPSPDTWDARGTRITSVLRDADAWVAFYDGRPTSDENWFERTGVATGAQPDAFIASGGPTPAGRTARYLSVVDAPDGLRLYWEASGADGENDVRTAKVPRPESPSQS